MGELKTFTLPAGTVCKRNGIPFKLQHATQIDCHPDNWELIEEDFKPSAGIDVTTLSVLDVLEMCERDFAFIGGCTVTDQPSLPPSQRASWKMDVSLVLAAIACAREKLCGPEVAHIAFGCAGCGTPQPMEQPSVPPKCGVVLEGSCKTDGGLA